MPSCYNINNTSKVFCINHYLNTMKKVFLSTFFLDTKYYCLKKDTFDQRCLFLYFL